MIVGAAMAAGCVTTSGGDGGDGGAPDTPRARLDAGALDLPLIATRSRLELRARVDQGAGAVEARVSVAGVSGGLRAHGQGDQLVLDALDVDLAPIDVPSTVVAGGLRLTGLHLGLAAPVATRDLVWSVDGDAAIGSAPLALDLDWAIDTGDGAYPLARQHLGPLASVVTIATTDLGVEVEVDAWAPGPAWSWAGIVGLGDVALILAAAEGA